ncbi:asparagine synthase-related protein [Piscinibacter sp. XHJ-5]|uniref:asparagine synthase n=1 Tax=Piscinibacter sp. XHJ-5 TaxID=3037797 RepID=UPI002452C3C1|nr:asparagine synthase-related protein [Piscinibacter sp. XHJ-5]
MRGLCGWFANRPVDDGAQVVPRMLANYHGTVQDIVSAHQPQAGLAAFGAPARPVLLEHDGFVLLVAGHPRLRGSDRSAIDLPALVRRLRESGKDALAALGGDFALAAWDGQRQRGLLAVDRLGIHQLMVARPAASLVFGSTLDLLFGHEGVPRQLSPQGIFDYLYYHVTPGPDTIYAGLQRLAPGHCIEFGPQGAGPAAPYWTMRFTEERGRSVDELKQEFVGLLRDAVREASSGVDAFGAFLSGGTDSSTVSGTLGQVSGRPARTFSIGFDVPGYDETEYARIAARHFGTEHHEYYVTPNDVVESLPRIAASYDQPFGNASAVPTYHCARVAREHGVTRLLAGDGGDELFGGNERYAKQHLLGLYQRVPAPLRRFVVEPLLAAPGVGAVPPLRKLRSYVEQARPPMPLRYESYNLLQHFGVPQMFTPEFLATVDAHHPSSLLADAYAPFKDASLINQMLAIDMRFILADGDLPKVSHMCNLAGVDVAFPLMDDRIIDFSGRLPDELKLRGTQLRWFFKQALLDFLPPEIITKKKHGFGLPVGHWLIAHEPLFDLANDSIERLRPRGIVRPEFVRQLLDVKLREHPGYYGVMVWVLMMLGLWLDSRKL